MLMSTARDFIRPEKAKEYNQLITALIDATRAETGNIQYVLYEDLKNDGEFILLEEWESEEDLEKHFISKHFTTIVPQIKLLQKNPSEVNIYKKIY